MKRSILLLISHSCNLSCKYCYERFKDSRRMGIERAIAILECEFENNPEEITNVDLLGGEPLSNFEVIPAICDWIWQRNSCMQVFIRTNGTLLTPEMKKWFQDYREKIGLGLSIDGTPQMNFKNRGVRFVDIDYFKENWPDIPVKMTIFPDSTDDLFESFNYLYNKGLKVTGGLAQGVNWSIESCNSLRSQLELLIEYYVENPSIEVPSPLFSLDFNHAFERSENQNKPCWEQQIVHTYDCDNEMLPCHMFSTLVQGNRKRQTILIEADNYTECKDTECLECPISWTCINCPALNYQHTGDFKVNINKQFSCEAHKITASLSAKLLVNRAMKNQIDIANADVRNSLNNAIRYLKTFDYGEKNS